MKDEEPFMCLVGWQVLALIINQRLPMLLLRRGWGCEDHFNSHFCIHFMTKNNRARGGNFYRRERFWFWVDKGVPCVRAFASRTSRRGRIIAHEQDEVRLSVFVKRDDCALRSASFPSSNVHVGEDASKNHHGDSKDYDHKCCVFWENQWWELAELNWPHFGAYWMRVVEFDPFHRYEDHTIVVVWRW